MNRLPRALLIAAFAMHLVAGPAEGTVRKCQVTPNGLPVLNHFPYVALDGVVLGQSPPVQSVSVEVDRSGPDGNAQLNVEPTASAPAIAANEPRPSVRLPGGIELDVEDLLHMEIACLEVERDGEKIGATVIAMFTKSGAVEVMRSYLDALAQAQMEYQTAKGVYAQELAWLRFFVSRPPLPIQMVVADGQWTASIRIPQQETTCHVSSAIAPIDQRTAPTYEVSCL